MHEYLKKLFGDRIEQVDTLASDTIQSTDIVNMIVHREAVESGHLQSYLNEFKRIEEKKSAMRSRIILSYYGYDFDPREVYQIPEIRKWTHHLLQNIPHLFYFISPEAYSMRAVFMSIIDVGVTTKDSARLIIEKIVQDAVSYSKEIGDTTGEQFALAQRIMSETGYERTL